MLLNSRRRDLHHTAMHERVAPRNSVRLLREDVDRIIEDFRGDPPAMREGESDRTGGLSATRRNPGTSEDTSAVRVPTRGPDHADVEVTTSLRPPNRSAGSGASTDRGQASTWNAERRFSSLGHGVVRSGEIDVDSGAAGQSGVVRSIATSGP